MDQEQKIIITAVDQATAVVNELRRNIEAAARGVNQALNPVNQAFAATQTSLKSVKTESESAAGGMDHLNFSSVGAKRELLVLMHELSQGNFSKFGGSLLVLGERVDALGAIASPAGLAIGALAAIVGGFALAAYKGHEESQELLNDLQMTGNMAGLTEDRFRSLAAQVAGQTSSSVGVAKEALLALAKSGTFTGDTLLALGDAAVNMSRVTGRSADEVVAELEKMGNGVAKYASDANQHYHFLTLAQYEHIQALEQEGRAQDAMRATGELLNTHFAKQEVELGYLARDWKFLSETAKGAWQAMLGLGTTDTVGDQLRRVQGQIANAQQQQQAGLTANNPNFEASYQRLLAQRDALAAKMASEQSKAAADAKAASEEAAKIQAKDWYDAFSEKYKTSAERLATDIKVYTTKATAAGVSAAQQAIDIARIRKGFTHEDDSQSNAAVEALKKQYQLREDALKTSLDHVKSLREQGVISTQQEIDQEHDLRTKAFEDELANLQKREQLLQGKNQRSALEAAKGEESRIKQQQADEDQRYTDAIAANAARRITAISAYREALDADLQARQAAVNLQVAGVGMGDQKRQNYERQVQIQDEYAKKLASLNKQAVTLDPDIYSAELQALKDWEDQRVAVEQDAIARIAAANADWTNGAKRALDDYATKAADVAGQTRDLMTNAFQGMEDALVNFVQTGKLSFTSLANSIIADLIRMQTRAAIASASQGGGFLSSILKALTGGSPAASTSAASTAGASTPGDWAAGLLESAKGNVFSNGQLTPFANGGAFTNGIVTMPTRFNMGLMGEKGPEAIMPLTRGADGRLGVAGSTGGVNVTVNVINAPAGSSATSKTRTNANGDITVDVMLDQLEKRQADKINQGTSPVGAAIAKKYGLGPAYE